MMTGWICKHSSLSLLYEKEGVSQGGMADLHILSPRNARGWVSPDAGGFNQKLILMSPFGLPFGGLLYLGKQQKVVGGPGEAWAKMKHFSSDLFGDHLLTL